MGIVGCLAKAKTFTAQDSLLMEERDTSFFQLPWTDLKEVMTIG